MSKYLKTDYSSNFGKLKNGLEYLSKFNLPELSQEINKAIENEKAKVEFLAGISIQSYKELPLSILKNKTRVLPKVNSWDYEKKVNVYEAMTPQEKLAALRAIKDEQVAVDNENKKIAEDNHKVYKAVYDFLVKLGFEHYKSVLARTKTHTVESDWVGELTKVCKTDYYSRAHDVTSAINNVESGIYEEQKKTNAAAALVDAFRRKNLLNLEVLKYREKYGLPEDTDHTNIANNFNTFSPQHILFHSLMNSRRDISDQVISVLDERLQQDYYDFVNDKINLTKMVENMVVRQDIKADIKTDYPIINNIAAKMTEIDDIIEKKGYSK